MKGHDSVDHRIVLSCFLSSEPPVVPLPEGCHLKRFESSDLAAWVALQNRADIYTTSTPELFYTHFGVDSEEQSQRILLLYEHNKLVGTVAAWYGGHGHSPSMGRLHWLAVSPEVQGRGYGNLLVALCLNRLYEKGHKAVYLTTSTLRPVAIALYRKHGFKEAL